MAVPCSVGCLLCLGTSTPPPPSSLLSSPLWAPFPNIHSHLQKEHGLWMGPGSQCPLGWSLLQPLRHQRLSLGSPWAGPGQAGHSPGTTALIPRLSLRGMPRPPIRTTSRVIHIPHAGALERPWMPTSPPGCLHLEGKPRAWGPAHPGCPSLLGQRPWAVGAFLAQRAREEPQNVLTGPQTSTVAPPRLCVLQVKPKDRER